MITSAPPESKPGAAEPVLRKRNLLLLAGIAAALVLLAGSSLLSVAVGPRGIPLATVADALTGDSGPSVRYIVWELRVPRTLTAIAVGVAVGVAGALMQALTRNPLADPGLLGINPGAAACVAVAIGALGVRDLRALVWFAFLGAALAGTVMYLLASGGRAKASPVRLALAGMAVTAVLTGLTQAVMLLSTHALDQMRFWTVASLAKSSNTTLLQVTPFLVAGVLLAAVLIRPLNALALGDETSQSLGTHPARTRVVGLVAITLLCGAATAAVGPLMFVGLAVPYIARLVTGPDQRWILPYSAMLAPILMLLADVLGRVVAREELEVGVVTAVIGAPVFIALVRRRRITQL